MKCYVYWELARSNRLQRFISLPAIIILGNRNFCTAEYLYRREMDCELTFVWPPLKKLGNCAVGDLTGKMDFILRLGTNNNLWLTRKNTYLQREPNGKINCS